MGINIQTSQPALSGEKHTGSKSAANNTSTGSTFAFLLDLLGQSGQGTATVQKTGGLPPNQTKSRFKNSPPLQLMNNYAAQDDRIEDTLNSGFYVDIIGSPKTSWNESPLEHLTQNLLDINPAQDEKTWGALSNNFTCKTGSQKPETKNNNTQIPGMFTDHDTFSALTELLQQLNPELVSNLQQNRPTGTAEEASEQLNQPVFEYLAQSLLDIYSAQNEKSWGTLSNNFTGKTGSQKPETKNNNTQIPGMFTDHDTFSALTELLRQFNPELVSNPQQNHPTGTAEEAGKQLNQPVFEYLAQSLLDIYSAQNEKSWGTLNNNFTGKTGSQKPETENNDAQVSGKFMDHDTFATLTKLLQQFNPESISDTQQSRPTGITKEVNALLFQYLTQNLGWDTQSAHGLIDNYSAQINKTWGKYSKNILQLSKIPFDPNSIYDQTRGTGITGGETFSNYENTSKLLHPISDAKIHTGRLAANNSTNTALNATAIQYPSTENHEGNKHHISQGDKISAAQQIKSESARAGLFVQGTLESTKLEPGTWQPNQGKNMRIPDKIQNTTGDANQATRSAGKQTVNQGVEISTRYAKDNPGNTQQPLQNNEDQLPATKSDSLKSNTASTTTNVKEINIGNRDAQPMHQIQLQPGRDSAPAAQQGQNNSGISQQVQLAARVAPLIRQAVSNNQGTTSLHLKLKPEHLGEVTVRLVYNQGNLHAHFIAANAQARELLDQSMVHLKENLSQLNINLNDASTSSGDESNRWGQQSSFQQRQHQARENEPAMMPPDELTPDDPLNETGTSENKGLNHLV